MKGKRWFYVLLAIWLLCGWAGWALGEDTLMVANPNPEDRLHLRAAPSTSAASLGKYYNGTCVAALQFHRNGWAEVQVGPLRGYMSMQYLSAELQASAMPAVEAPWQGIRLFALPDEQSTSQELPGYARIAYFNVGEGAAFRNFVDERFCHGGGSFPQVQQHVFALFNLCGVAAEGLCKLYIAGIHIFSL